MSGHLSLLLTTVVIAIALIVPPSYWPVHGVLLVAIFVGHSVAGIPLRYVARRLAVFLPMVLMLSFSVPLAEGLRGGWEIMAAILLRSTLSFLAVLWLVNVTPFDELLCTLRRLWVPAVLVAMLAFMYRYVFVLWDEQDRMRRARAARTFRTGSLWSRWTMAATQIGMLLLRSMHRAERVHKAMLARGWDGRVRTLD